MVKKCCVYGCRTNYSSELKQQNEKEVFQENNNKLSVYRFPKDPSERERWKKAVPNENLIVSDNTVICEAHWPPGFETIKHYGKYRPKYPPSVWDGIPASQIPTVPPPLRPTNRALSGVRSRKEDELASFIKIDKTTFSNMKDEMTMNKRTFTAPVTAFMFDSILYIQSVKFLKGIPLFVVKISENLRFETFHCGVKCYVATLSKNYLTTVDSWSKLEEIIRYLYSLEVDHKKEIIQQQLSVMCPKIVGTHIYGTEIIVRAFEYFATSRSLYNRLREDYKLPSISTLTRITSKVSKLSENTFLNGIFNSVENNQKLCILLHDEIYVKKMLLFHGGTLFGKSVDDPSSLAKTMLGIMIVCLYGVPKFLSKMLPISKLNSNFLLEQIDVTNQAILSAGGEVKVIICDGNRTNQAFFKKFNTVPEKPWLTENGQYLLFDYVHLLKNIRNLWLTEKMGELIFEDNGIIRTAKWSHLKQLFELESGSMIKLSSLNEVAVAPKPVERQRVSSCLRVFCERTYHALLNHSGLSDDKYDTAIFLNKVITWWKIINVKGKGADIRHNDPLQAVISDR